MIVKDIGVYLSRRPRLYIEQACKDFKNFYDTTYSNLNPLVKKSGI